jgi:hypothetical protein
MRFVIRMVPIRFERSEVLSRLRKVITERTRKRLSDQPRPGKKILGLARYKLWRNGRASLVDVIGGNGESLHHSRAERSLILENRLCQN